MFRVTRSKIFISLYYEFCAGGISFISTDGSRIFHFAMTLVIGDALLICLYCFQVMGMEEILTFRSFLS